MATKYAFRLKGLHHELDAQSVGEEMEKLIDDRKEHVTHEEIIANARRRDSAMHRAFTWDENAAADAYRKTEARKLTQNIAIAKNGEATKTTAFVYIHHPEYGGKKVLMSRRSAMARADMREEVIEQGIRYLQRTLSYWGHAYGGNAAFRSLAKDVKALKRKVEREMLAVI